MRTTPISRGLILAAVFGLCLSPTLRAADAKPAEGFDALIFDRNAFVSHLPKMTIVAVNDRVPQQKVESMKRALARLGRIPGVEFLTLPKGTAVPEVKDWVAPIYPRNLPRPTDPHQSTFLLLIGGEGRPLLLYCTETTERDVAVAAAKAIVRWTFTPAIISGHAIPVLVVVDAVVPPIE